MSFTAWVVFGVTGVVVTESSLFVKSESGVSDDTVAVLA